MTTEDLKRVISTDSEGISPEKFVRYDENNKIPGVPESPHLYRHDLFVTLNGDGLVYAGAYLKCSVFSDKNTPIISIADSKIPYGQIFSPAYFYTDGDIQYTVYFAIKNPSDHFECAIANPSGEMQYKTYPDDRIGSIYDNITQIF